MPILEGCADIIPDVDWDTWIAKGGVEQGLYINLFQNGISYRHTLTTSMYLMGVFPLPEHKNVTNLQIAFGSYNNPDDMRAFKERAYYEFWIGSKIYDHAPLSRFQWWNTNIVESYEMLEIVSKIKGSSDLKVIGNEVEYRIRDNPIGHHILQGQSFAFKFLFEKPWTPIQDFKVVVFLKGIKSRGVQ